MLSKQNSQKSAYIYIVQIWNANALQAVLQNVVTLNANFKRKQIKWNIHHTKTKICLGIKPVW